MAGGHDSVCSARCRFGPVRAARGTPRNRTARGGIAGQVNCERPGSVRTQDPNGSFVGLSSSSCPGIREEVGGRLCGGRFSRPQRPGALSARQCCASCGPHRALLGGDRAPARARLTKGRSSAEDLACYGRVGLLGCRCEVGRGTPLACGNLRKNHQRCSFCFAPCRCFDGIFLCRSGGRCCGNS